MQHGQALSETLRPPVHLAGQLNLELHPKTITIFHKGLESCRQHVGTWQFLQHTIVVGVVPANYFSPWPWPILLLP